MRASVVSVLAIPGLAVALGLAMPATAQVSVNLDALNPPPAGQAAPQTTRPTRPATTRPAARPRPPANAAAARRTSPAPSSPNSETPPADSTAAAPAGVPAGAPSSTSARPATARPQGTRAPATPPAASAAQATNPAAQQATSPQGRGVGVGATAGAAAVGAAAAGAAAAGAATLALPDAAPATPVIAPPSPPATVVAVPPPQRPATSASAGSTIAPLPEGLRVTFASGKADLTPDSAASLTDFARKIPATEGVSVNVVAFAAGMTEDPSTTRRLALSRALAIRAALMSDGIASTRIYVRAMGAPPATDAGPVDRVDISLLGGNNTQATGPTTTGPATTGAPPTARP